MAKYDNLNNFLQSWSNEIIEGAKEELRAKNKGGGNLENSLRADVYRQGDNFVVQFYMADYGTFVDKGVKGAGGTIKTGKHKGTWGGRRWFVNYKGERKDAPYQFGTGTGKKGGMSRGIGSFIRKKNLQPRDERGRFQTTAGLKIAIMKVLWVKGIHGISFFQKPLMLGLQMFKLEAQPEVKEDIIENLVTFPNVRRA
jgi:hypothetical protein